MIAATLAAVLLVLPQSATGTQTNSGADAAKDTADANKQICRSVRVTGSRMREQICQTAAEWADYDAAAARGNDRLQRDGGGQAGSR